VYHLCLIRPFRAQHFLVGGDWGAENLLHWHDFRAEWTLGGTELNEHGYLLDLLAVEVLLDRVLEEVSEKVLNELKPFHGLNPSVERLARHLSDRLLDQAGQFDPKGRLSHSRLVVFENETAWASWSQDLPPLGEQH